MDFAASSVASGHTIIASNGVVRLVVEGDFEAPVYVEFNSIGHVVEFADGLLAMAQFAFNGSGHYVAQRAPAHWHNTPQ